MISRRESMYAGLAVLLGLALCACSVEKQQARFPTTTQSKAARESYEQGRDLFLAGRLNEARQSFGKAVEQDPNFALGWLGVAEAAPHTAARSAALARAAALVEGVSEGERRWIQGYQAGMLGDMGTQLEHYSTIVRLYPDDERAHTLFAEHLLATREYAAALSSLTRATEVAPDYAPAYLMLARANAASGNLEQSKAAVEEYVRRKPAEPIGYALRGEALMKTGDFAGGITAYEEALTHDAHFAEAYVGLGVAQVLLGQGPAAQATFDRLSQNARDDADRRLALLWMGLAQLFEGHPEQALDPLRRRLALAEQAQDDLAAAEDHALLGDVWLEVPRPDDAAAEYHAVAETIGRSSLADPIKEAVLARQPYHEARVALARGDLTTAQAKAMQYRERAVKGAIASEGSRQQELMGEIKLQAGDAASAVRMLQRLGPGDARTQWLLASALQRSGDPARAVGPCRLAAQFNAAEPSYAFVRRKALVLLPELERQAAEQPAAERRAAQQPMSKEQRIEAARQRQGATPHATDREARVAAAKERQAAARKAQPPEARPPAGR